MFRVRFLETHSEYQLVENVSDEPGAPAPRGENLGDLSRDELFRDVPESKSFVCCGCYKLRAEPFFRIYPEKRIPEYDEGQDFQMLLPFLFRHRRPTIGRKLYRVHARADRKPAGMHGPDRERADELLRPHRKQSMDLLRQSLTL